MPSYGWKRSPPDPRDWRFSVPKRVTAVLPPAFSIEAGLGFNLDQQNIGSCGPNAADECVMFDDKVEGLPVTSASRLFIYWNARGGTPTDDGVENRAMLKSLAQYGYCDETVWPYDTAKFSQKPPQAAFDAALPARITSYATVAQTLDQMKGCIVAGRPFMFGFMVFKQIESDEAAMTGIVRDPSPGETPIGGHDVTFCGYSDSKVLLDGSQGAFLFRNHWRNANGSWWGDPAHPGCGWISYKYAADPNLAGDFWVINAVPVPGTPPPPPPPPPPPIGSPCRKVARAIFRGVQAAHAELRSGAENDSGGGFVDFLDRFCPKILGG